MSTESSKQAQSLSQYIPIVFFAVFVGVWGLTLSEAYNGAITTAQYQLLTTAERLGKTVERQFLNHEQQAITLAEAVTTLPSAEFHDICSTYVRRNDAVALIYTKDASLKPVRQIQDRVVRGLDVRFPLIADSSYYVIVVQPTYYASIWRIDKEKYVAIERPIIVNGAFRGVVGLVVSLNRLFASSIHSIAMSGYDAALIRLSTSDVLASTSSISFDTPVQSGYTLQEIGIDLRLEMADTTFSFWKIETLISTALGGSIAFLLFIWMYSSLRTMRLLKQTEQTLRESEERFRILWDHSADGMRLTDRYGRVVMVNQAYADLVKMSPQKLTEEYRSGKIDDTRYASDSTYRHMFDAGLVKMPIAQTIRRSDGEQISVEIINSFIHLPDGEKMMLSIYRDVTSRKKLEEELQQVQRMDTLGRFAIEIGNNLNNILGIILNASELLKPKISGMVDAMEYLSMITVQTKRGAELAGDLLVFARTDQKEEREISVPKSLEHARKILEYSLPPTVSLSVSLGDNNAVVMGDIHELHQAVVNLALAAKERMENGGRISITSFLMGSDDARLLQPNVEDKQYVAIMINDNGAILNNVQKQMVFEPYFNTQVQQSGVGLRLAVVYGVVKRHHGFARVESDEEHGTTFTLYFPIVRHEDIPFGLEEPQPPEQGKGLVLLVDDEEAYRVLYEQEFLSLGYSVLIAKDGEEALRTYEHYMPQISLVITDISMPNVNGEELFQQLVRMNPDVKVIFATGNIDARSRAELMHLGVKGIVEKPFSFAELMTLVQKVLHEWV